MENIIQILSKSAKELLATIPPKFGFCAHMSSTWAQYLEEQYSISAQVVAGDLALKNQLVFECKKNVSMKISDSWGGHCWIEVNGYIGDLSLFRTAYNGETSKTHLFLKDYVQNKFGKNRGGLIIPISALPSDMQYIKKFLIEKEMVEHLHYATCCILHNGN